MSDDRRRSSGRRSADKVRCPHCGYAVSTVLDSRRMKRLRACDGCGGRYVTRESVERLVPREMNRLPDEREEIAAT